MTGLSPALIPIPVQSQEQWPSALQASYEVRENPHPTWECYLGRNHGGEKKCFNYVGSSCWGLCWGFMRIPPLWYGLPELGSFSASKLSKNQRWPSIAAPLFWQRQAPTEQLDTTNVPTSHADTHTHTHQKKNEPTSFVAGTIFPTQLELNCREPPLVKKHAKREVLQTSHETKKDGLNACKRPCRWWHQTVTGWWWKWPKLYSSNLHVLIFLR